MFNRTARFSMSAPDEYTAACSTSFNSVSSPSNVVEFPYRPSVGKVLGPCRVLEGKRESATIVGDLALLTAVVAEMRRLALAAKEVLETAESELQAEIADDSPASPPIR